MASWCGLMDLGSLGDTISAPCTVRRNNPGCSSANKLQVSKIRKDLSHGSQKSTAFWKRKANASRGYVIHPPLTLPIRFKPGRICRNMGLGSSTGSTLPENGTQHRCRDLSQLTRDPFRSSQFGIIFRSLDQPSADLGKSAVGLVNQKRSNWITRLSRLPDCLSLHLPANDGRHQNVRSNFSFVSQ